VETTGMTVGITNYLEDFKKGLSAIESLF